MGSQADFPFKPFSILWHESLFDEVKHGVPLDRFELRVQRQRPCEVHHDLSGPVNAETDEACFAHHRVTCFVPELAGHVPVIIPRFV